MTLHFAIVAHFTRAFTPRTTLVANAGDFHIVNID
jgi:hypothetical protein